MSLDCSQVSLPRWESQHDYGYIHHRLVSISPDLPSISIRISTHIPTFDLSLNTPFMISVILTLHHHHPITFRKRDTRFFTHPLESTGLEFINIRTRETQAGMRIQLRYIGLNDDELPTVANREDWITLRPDQPYLWMRISNR